MSNKTPGRPRIHKAQKAKMDNYAARVTAWHARTARGFGGGNFSAGVRWAIEHCAEIFKPKE